MAHYQRQGGGSRDQENWKEAAPAYREILFRDGEERHREDPNSAAVSVARKGMSREEVEQVLKRRGRLGTAEMVLCRVRAFSDGAVIGTKKFLEEFFGAKREFFGPNRTSGSRPIYGCETELRAARGLRKNALG